MRKPTQMQLEATPDYWNRLAKLLDRTRLKWKAKRTYRGKGKKHVQSKD